MSVNRFTEKKPEKTTFSQQTLFDLIYSGAKEKNFTKIQSALLHASININNCENVTPAHQLALEGTQEAKEALDFLMTTNPKERLALLKYMASGYAQGGHVAQADSVLARAANAAERLTLLRYMAFGYAQGGHVAQADSVLARAANAERLALLKEMAYGYALGGHVTQEDSVLARAANAAERLTLLRYMAFGYAQGGHVAQADSVLARAANAERLALLKEMAYGYALGGHVTQEDSVLARAANAAERLALLKLIARVIKEKGLFYSDDSALFMLAVFKPSYQQELVTELNESKGEMKVNVTALVPKATQLHPLITTPSSLTRPINFRYRLGKDWPRVQEFLLMTGVDLVKRRKLNNNLLLLIATFLADINAIEALNFSNKLYVTYRPNLFYADLAKHNRLLTTDSSIIDKEKKPTR